MNKQDLATILCINRGLTIESGLDKNGLEQLLGNITQSDINFMEYWNKLVISNNVSLLIYYNFQYHDYNDCKMYLQTINSASFPIPLTYLLKNKKENIVAYYYMHGMKVTIDVKNFNIQQLDVINQDRSVTVVNAGPGTGKTTTACEKAFRLREEGVIFLSYTNAAVKEDMYRMFVYADVSKQMSSDKLDKKLIFKTIDSLVGGINGGISETYDHSIRDAINMINKRGYRFTQRHIIIDECQDIDDLRCEFIATIFNKCGFLSLTVLGDPRQKINTNTGNWYRNLWIESKTGNVTLCGIKHKCESIGFTISHRFKSQNIVNLVNQLSLRRPELHCELNITYSEPSEIVEQPIIVYGNANDSILIEIANYILQLNKVNKVPFNEFMIIGPSLSSESNKTSKYARKISEIFRKCGVPCKLQSQGSYNRNGVLFSTIHSCKGKEADYVFIFGMDNYPNSFNMIPYETAESLIYIAHSRARKKIFYMMREEGEVKLPRGIIIENVHVINGSVNTIESIKEPKDTFKNVTDLCKDFGFLQLMETNRCSLNYNEKLINIPEMPYRDEYQDFYGTFVGLLIGIFTCNKLPNIITDFINGKFRKIEDSKYSSLKYKGSFVDGYFNDELTVKESLKLSMISNNILTYNTNQYYELVVLYIKLSSGENYIYEGTMDDNLINYCRLISIYILETYGNVLEFEYRVKYDKLVGSIDLITSNYVIEIKTKNTIEFQDILQCYLYKSCVSNRNAILIDLNRKTEYKILSNRNDDYWRYLISRYFDIKHITECINHRSNSRETLSSFNNNTFTIDTEFDMSNGRIFEISIFNTLFPYKSIVQIVYSPEVNFGIVNNWLPNVTIDLFMRSPQINEIYDMFVNLCRLYNNTPVLYYYKCDIDVSWCNFATKYDFSKAVSSICCKGGVFSSNIKVPKLIDYYNSHITFADLNERLQHHTALSDTLMLYEIILTYQDELNKFNKK